MKISEMIAKWRIELAEKDGQVAIRFQGKATPKQREALKAAKQEIIAELQRREAETTARRKAAQLKAAAEAEAELREIMSGEKPIALTYYDGEYLSGWKPTGQSVGLMKKLGLAKYVSGWGYLVDFKVIDALGTEFTYIQAAEYAKPLLEAKAKKQREAEEKRAALEAEQAAMSVRVLEHENGTPGEDGTDPYAKVEITDPATGEKAQFTCRNIFDFGYVVNPNYPVVGGMEPGGLATKRNDVWYWEEYKAGKGWYMVRPLTAFEVKSLEYLTKFPPIGTGARI